MTTAPSASKIILIHGNGGDTAYSSWLPQVASDLEDLGLTVINETFPDNQLARAQYWLPHIRELGADDRTVIIGYSSGAVAAMRYAEAHALLGSVLVGASYTDLGDTNERASGYYDTPWDWQAIKRNQQFILQFASTNDPYIPIAEARFIQKHLGSKLTELDKRGHFEDNTFPELTKALKKHLNL
jgi:predicted alpha/beta hydrolase family esterase